MPQAFREAAFALEFDPHAQPWVRDVIAVAWTTDTLQVLAEIRQAVQQRKRDAQEPKDTDTFINLPFASLRAALHLEISPWATIKDDLGLRNLFIPFGRDPEPWGYVETADAAWLRQGLQDAFARWTEGALAQYGQYHQVPALGIAALRQLNLADQVVQVRPSRVQLFPWGHPGRAGAPTPFDITAGALASHLAGHELFPELGPVVRVIGGADRNRAELMTRPHHAANGWFSLVGELSVETLPGAEKPLVYCRFKRRRWASAFKQGYSPSASIGAFVFPHAKRPFHAYRFEALRHRGQWVTDHGYPHYVHAFGLAPGFVDERVMHYPSDAHASVVVMSKAEVATDAASELQAGVPVVDQAHAFQNIAQALSGLGLQPFRDFRVAKTTAIKAPPLAMLKAEATLAKLLERRAEPEDDASSVEDQLHAITHRPASRWFKKGVPPPDPGYQRTIAAIRQLTADTASAADPERRTIYVVSHAPDDLAWVKTTAEALLGSAFRVISAPLPLDTHGPKTSLPGAHLTSHERFNARRRAWDTFATDNRLPPRAMVLVIAPKFYAASGHHMQPDDWINKPAARKALGAYGCTVQYLLPSNPGHIDTFLPRVQAALLDLVFGHAGSVWGLRQACERCFRQAAPAPRWVGAVGSLVVRTAWNTSQSVFVATKLDCTTGQAWVRFAHHSAEDIQTPWMRFDEGAQYLAERRIELPRAHVAQRALLASFFTSTFDQIAAQDPCAVIFIQSTRLARLATWLSDRGIREAPLAVSPAVSVPQRWPSLRLIRIREQTPAIGQEKTHDVMTPDGHVLRTWTSTRRLFEVGAAAAPTFWSMDNPFTQKKRGVSCYRDMLLRNSKKTEAHPGDCLLYPAQPDAQHLNTQALEIVILHQHRDDDSVALASFAQHLRAGMLTARNERWVTSPTPLRIIDKLAEYLEA